MMRQIQTMLFDAEAVDAIEDATVTTLTPVPSLPGIMMVSSINGSLPYHHHQLLTLSTASNNNSREVARTSATNSSALFLLRAFCTGMETESNGDSNKGSGNATSHLSHIDHVTAVIYTRVIVALAAFGLLGNTLNLVVLTLRSRQSRGRMERFAYTGLTALALADGLFCLTVLPHGVTSYYQRFLFHTLSFDLVYGLCGVGLFNTCVTCSTWLTVMLACGRYLAVCHPVKARQVSN